MGENADTEMAKHVNSQRQEEEEEQHVVVPVIRFCTIL